MKILVLLMAFACAAPAAAAENRSREDIKDIAEARRLAEQIAHLTWPFEQASSSSATKGLLELGELARAELAAARPEKAAQLKALPEFTKLDYYGYRDAVLAVSQNLLVFLGAGASLPDAALRRAGDKARALLPLLGAEALRISVADPKSLYDKRIDETDKELKEIEKDMLETDSMLSLAELMLALGDYRRLNGAPPARLEQLVPDFIKAIPPWVSRHHAGSSKVLNYGGSDKKPAKAATDAGGWLYFASPLSKYYGQVMPNCRHKDQHGKPAYLMIGPQYDGPLAGQVTAH